MTEHRERALGAIRVLHPGARERDVQELLDAIVALVAEDRDQTLRAAYQRAYMAVQPGASRDT